MREYWVFRWMLIAAISGLLSVLIGAVADHVLYVAQDDIARHAIETASKYHMVYTVLIFVIACYLQKQTSATMMLGYLHSACIFFLLGLLCFCGGVYLDSMTQIHQFVYMVPFGGISFMLGWVQLIRFAWSLRGQG